MFRLLKINNKFWVKDSFFQRESVPNFGRVGVVTFFQAEPVPNFSTKPARDQQYLSVHITLSKGESLSRFLCGSRGEADLYYFDIK